MCFQEIEVYTCTHEVPPVSSKDFETVFCGCPIIDRGTEGRFKIMRGAPHKLTEFPVFCGAARREGRGGEYCPEFEYRWVYTRDPKKRYCSEHVDGETDLERAIVASERQVASAQWKRESDRSRAAYLQKRMSIDSPTTSPTQGFGDIFPCTQCDPPAPWQPLTAPDSQSEYDADAESPATRQNRRSTVRTQADVANTSTASNMHSNQMDWSTLSEPMDVNERPRGHDAANCGTPSIFGPWQEQSGE